MKQWFLINNSDLSFRDDRFDTEREAVRECERLYVEDDIRTFVVCSVFDCTHGWLSPTD